MGDLFFLTLFISYIAEQEKKLTVDNVLKGIADKLIRRHPHVFGGLEEDNVNRIIENWESIKLSEAKNQKRKTPFDGIPKGLPEIQRFFKILEKTRQAGKEIKNVKKKDLKEQFESFLQGSNDEKTTYFIENFFIYCFINKIDLPQVIRKISDQKIDDFKAKYSHNS